MKATPALDHGDVGSSNAMMFRFFSKTSLTLSIICWSMWVSCRANIAILFSCSVLHISLHLLMRGISYDVAPFMFSIAMLMLAFLICFFLWFSCVWFVCPGVGLRWCSHGPLRCVWGFFLPLIGCRLCKCGWAQQYGCPWFICSVTLWGVILMGGSSQLYFEPIYTLAQALTKASACYWGISVFMGMFATWGCTTIRQVCLLCRAVL